MAKVSQRAVFESLKAQMNYSDYDLIFAEGTLSSEKVKVAPKVDLMIVDFYDRKTAKSIVKKIMNMYKKPKK